VFADIKNNAAIAVLQLHTGKQNALARVDTALGSGRIRWDPKNVGHCLYNTLRGGTVSCEI
jgi:hypothetical protein